MVKASTAIASTAGSRGRSRRRYVLFAVIGLLVLIASMGGYAIWRISDTLSTINSHSTPPPIVSGSILGGSPDVAIDTGPAQTAVALNKIKPTRTPVPMETATVAAPSPSPAATLAITPRPTLSVNLSDTAAPTVESTVPEITAPSATATIEAVTPAAPTAVPTVLSDIERITNGSFESGSDPWYLENGTGPVAIPDAPDGQYALEIPVTGGYADQKIFFVPGTDYVLSASARVASKGDIGEVGVVYLDADGNRRQDLEPKPIAFKRTAFTTKTLSFTPPDGVTTIKIFAYKDSAKANSTGVFDVDQISVRSVITPFTAGGDASDPPNIAPGSMTILVMGVDARDGEAIDGQVRPDSLMVIHLDPASDSCHVLSVPRDSRTDLPGYGLTKINHALAVGGIDYEVQVVSSFLNVPIDHYVLVDFNGFEALVDALGGVTVDVPAAFTAVNGMAFAPGEQQMDGKQALTYARHRSDNEGDFGRIKRQQQILRAVIAQTGGLDIVSSFNELLPAIGSNFRTDLSLQEMIDLARTYRSICTEDAITLLSLEGGIATFDDPLLHMPLSYVVVDESEIHRKVAALLEP